MPLAQPILPLLSAVRCWVQGRRIYLELSSHRSISFPASKYAVLENASQTELEKIRLEDGGVSVGWASLDELIRVEDVARDSFVHTPRAREIPAVAV